MTDGALLALHNAPVGAIKRNMPGILPWTRHEDWWLREAAFSALMGLQKDADLFLGSLPALIEMYVNEYYANYRISDDLIELRNLLHVAELIVRSASKRRESRGLHFNQDFPELSDQLEDTIMFPGSMDHLDMLRPIGSAGH